MSFDTSSLLALATIAATITFMVADSRASKRGKWIFKPLASALFVATGFAAGACDSSPGRWIAVGLVLGAIGDVLLIPDNKKTFLLGLGIFLLGHVAYVVSFLVMGADGGSTAMALLPLAFVAAIVWRWLKAHVEAKLRVPVLAYMVVITGMVALSFGAWRAGASWRWFAAAVSFYLSDLSVARDRFVSHGFVNRAWGLPLYYGAQLAFALTAGLLVAG
ncbi:MAG: lysoplasmalogenase [Deltaproteobacteria bacterium]|nr:lysoplasmalogenase [Deltaproteobacteria bacterium]